MKFIPQENTKFDEKIFNFVQLNLNYFFIVMIVVAAITIRYLFAGFISGDTVKYFVPWAEYLSEHGGFAGIATLESDYPVAYQYLLAITSFLPFSALSRVKIIVMTFDFGSAILVMALIKKLLKLPKSSLIPWIGFAITLFAPTVLLNSSLWGQCDIIYTFFLLLTLHLLISERFLWAFIAYGLAFSFKLQALFLFPFLIIAYFKTRKFNIFNFVWIPLTYILVYIPALMIGKPITELFEAYSMQVAEYPQMVVNLSNFYTLMPNDYELFHVPALILTAIVLFIFFAHYLTRTTNKMSNKRMIDVALLTVMICVYFLPAMHERYLFAADVIAIVYLFIHPKRWIVPILIWLISQNGYAPVLWGFGPIFEPKLLALIWMGLLGYLTWDITNDMKEIAPEATMDNTAKKSNENRHPR